MRCIGTTILWLLVPWWCTASGQGLTPVSDVNFGLKIVQFSVGQADAAALVTYDGHSCLIDLGNTNDHGEMIADFLADESLKGIKNFDTVDLLFISHYDKDHIGGATKLGERLKVLAAYDQGPSLSRSVSTPSGLLSSYGKYVQLVGDSNGNGIRDADEDDYVRHRAEYGTSLSLGDVTLDVVSVRGDTRGNEFDIDRDPSRDGRSRFDENPKSVILLVRLGAFEFLAGGDATCADWVSNTVSGTALALCGISAGTLIGATFVDSSKATSLSASQAMAIPNVSKHWWLDILSDVNGVSFYRFQLVAWTFVLGVVFLHHVFRYLEMPDFDEYLLALLGISAGTYLGYKLPENISGPGAQKAPVNPPEGAPELAI